MKIGRGARKILFSLSPCLFSQETLMLGGAPRFMKMGARKTLLLPVSLSIFEGDNMLREHHDE
jgi:hypothetical protein